MRIFRILFIPAILGILSWVLYVRYTETHFNERVREYGTDLVHVWGGMLRSRRTMGAISPSSPWLVDAILRTIPFEKNNIRILEVGAGSGIVTRQIARLLGPDDSLDVVELDDELCRRLDKVLAPWKEKHITIHCTSLQNFQSPFEGGYDFIISTLPLNQLPKQVVEQVLEKMSTLLKPGGQISYIAYFGGSIGRYLLSEKDRAEFDEKLAIVKHWKDGYTSYEDWVVLNIPPSRVFHLRSK